MQTPALEVILTDGASRFSSAQALSADSLTKMEAVIAPEASNANVAFGLDVSQIQMVMIHASAAMTVATRSSAGADVDVITLAAGKPIVWQASNGIAQSALFTADFVSLQVDSTPGGTLTIWALTDATV